MRAYSIRDGLELFACVRRTGRTLFLGDNSSSSSGSTYTGAVAVAGHLVAWWYRECGFPPEGPAPDRTYCGPNTVWLVDMRTGQHRALFALTGDAVVPKLVLTRSGSAAWIETWSTRDSRLLRSYDSRGITVLGAGTMQDGPRRLALRRSRVYWTQDGERRSAVLR